MRNYILSITICSLVGAFVHITAPEKIKKYISLVNTMIMITVILYPLTNNSFFDIEDKIAYNEVSETEVDINKIAASSIATSISNTIKNDYKIDVLSITVDINENSAFDINSIKVYITETTIDKSKIESKLQELYSCKILICEKG